MTTQLHNSHSGPSHGSLTLNANGSFTYTPDANYNGPDTFTYRASDATLTSNLATVTITVSAVNDAPAVTVAAGGTCGTMTTRARSTSPSATSRAQRRR